MARSKQPPDFLDEMIAESTGRNRRFPALLAAAEERRRIGSALAAARRARSLSQGEVAARMATTQSVVSKLERGDDVKLSTLQKYMRVVGVAFEELAAARRAR